MRTPENRPVHPEEICSRTECKFYEPGRCNHCMALREVYRNDKECKFFKEVQEVKR